MVSLFFRSVCLVVEMVGRRPRAAGDGRAAQRIASGGCRVFLGGRGSGSGGGGSRGLGSVPETNSGRTGASCCSSATATCRRCFGQRQPTATTTGVVLEDLHKVDALVLAGLPPGVAVVVFFGAFRVFGVLALERRQQQRRLAGGFAVAVGGLGACAGASPPRRRFVPPGPPNAQLVRKFFY